MQARAIVGNLAADVGARGAPQNCADQGIVCDDGRSPVVRELGGIKDPFTRCLERCLQLPEQGSCRLQLAQRYSYVVPQPHLLDVLGRYSPLVELGAGTGYWAHLVRLRGLDIVAFDQAPPGGERTNRYHPDSCSWTEVLEGDATVLAAHGDRSLFLCWPPAFSSLWEALGYYAGDLVIYVGDRGPRTARLAGLDARYQEVETYPALALDPAPGRPAELSVWMRRGRPWPRRLNHDLVGRRERGGAPKTPLPSPSGGAATRRSARRPSSGPAPSRA
jgi:hypothetical protein